MDVPKLFLNPKLREFEFKLSPHTRIIHKKTCRTNDELNIAQGESYVVGSFNEVFTSRMSARTRTDFTMDNTLSEYECKNVE